MLIVTIPARKKQVKNGINTGCVSFPLSVTAEYQSKS